MTNDPEFADASDVVLKDDDSRRLKNLRAEQDSIYQSLCHNKSINQKDLRMAWNRTDRHTLHAAILQFRNELHDKVNVKDQLDREGLGKFSSKLSAFATSIAKVFDAYSGISEIVRGIDNNVGPIAYGVFSIFLMVVQSKAAHRETTQHILEELDKWLPRVEVVRIEDVSSLRLKDHVLNVYVETIDFFQYMTKFLCSAKTSRAWNLISRPPKRDLQERLDRIKDKSNDLLNEVTFRLHEQMDEMAHQFHETKEELKDEMKEYAELSKRNIEENHHSQLRRVAKALKLPFEYDAFVTRMFAYCDNKDYQTPFKFQSKAAFLPTSLQLVSLEDLCQRPNYKAWMDTPQSSILLLGGENKDISVSRSWLSPVAIKVVHSVRRSAQCTAVFHSMNYARIRYPCPSPEHEILLALKSVLYQVLSEEIRLCQSFADDLVRDYSWTDAASTSIEQIQEQIRTCLVVLQEVLSSRSLRDRTIFMILDGVEKLPYPAPVTFFGSVLDLLSECSDQVTIKVLTICSVLGLREVKGVKGQDRLRRALELGADKEIMERVFADLSWSQQVLACNT